ncbi:PAS domain-containing sensor histidine kinase [Candidatus Nomurabacteria bacterium]|nr:PAS domain S-box protein [Candidatus Kaiserbacteria bacterium]MCB9814706.1 PAS domain-containing sensor histidine kinase [Candidatus Nomurabacteria bacterium]
MNPWSNQNKKAFFQSILVFTILFSAVILLTVYYDFTGVDMGGLLFLSAFLLCVFAAKNAYDTTRGAVSSAFLKKNVGESLDFTSEELYVQLYKNSPIPYLLIDIDGQVQSANLAAARMFGMTQANVTGLNVFSRVECDVVEHLDFLIEKFRRGVSISDEIVRVKREDFKEEWALLSLFRFTDIHGQRIGLLTLVDITKQKRAEDAKSEFVSLASHQLRTPIAGMKWSAELLQLDNPETLTDRQQKYIERLLISIKRMAILVDDFLRVSRFELGTFQAELEEVKLSELFEDIMSEQESRAKQKKLSVKSFYEKSIDTVITDPNLVRMIVTNLFSNAVKYTREKGTIHIGFGRKDDNIIITVADNGMGIPAEDQDSIFLKLFRASNAVRDVPDGTGLGLYIVHEAVSVLKGNITFTTTEGIGTTFEVLLPLELPGEKTKED